MSSADGDSDVSGGSQDVNAADGAAAALRNDSAPDMARADSELRHIIEEEQRDLRADSGNGTNGTNFHGYGKVKGQQPQEDLEPGSPSPSLPNRKASVDAMSPEGSISTPDDSPSVQVRCSFDFPTSSADTIQGSALSSPGSSIPASFASFGRGQRPPSLQPFERRFSARTPVSPRDSPRALSPAFLGSNSRQSSLSSQLLQNQDEADTPQPPWEVVRWTKLKRITGQAFSELGKRNFGRPTCLAVAASIIIGTSKGLILVFDYHQTLKSIIGPGTKGRRPSI